MLRSLATGKAPGSHAAWLLAASSLKPSPFKSSGINLDACSQTNTTGAEPPVLIVSTVPLPADSIWSVLTSAKNDPPDSSCFPCTFSLFIRKRRNERNVSKKTNLNESFHKA